jgi:hypothetical protein
MGSMSGIDPQIVSSVFELGKLVLENRSRRKLAEMNRDEALLQVAQATAAFTPKSNAELLDEGRAMAREPRAEASTGLPPVGDEEDGS